MNRLLFFIILIGSIFPVFGQIYKVGDIYTAEDGSQGIVYYIHPDGSGWIVALNDVSNNAIWGIEGDDVPGIVNVGQGSNRYENCLSDTAGYTNTSVLRAYQNNNPYFAASLVDLDHGWYIPAASQLSMLFAQLPFIEDKIIAAGGTTMAYASYMSSTEETPYQFESVDFSADNTYSGSFFYFHKNNPIYLRAVRSLHPLQNTYDTTLLYSWNNGVTEPHFQDAPQQTTNYMVIVTTEYGCTNTASSSVIVISDEHQTFYDTICKGESYNNHGFALSAEETDTAGDTSLTQIVSAAGCESEITLYLSLLSPDTFAFSQQACNSFEWNGNTYTEEGIHTQLFTNIHGCDSLVMMDLTLSNTDINIITNGNFCDQSSLDLLVETNAESFVWSTGDQTPQIVVVEPGLYSVTGTLNGCSDSAWITIEPCASSFYMPNAFTPNDDGKNSVFLPVFTYPDQIENYRMEIYNRWGGLVFRTEEKTFGWDGSNAPEGVYVVLVHYKTRGEKKKTVKGSVTVIR